MGVLMYGTEQFEIEDRLLSHLKVVITQKLRRQESFLLSWTHTLSEGSGRSSVWLSSYSSIHFRFSGSKIPALNKAWLDLMMQESHSPRGLVVDEVHEPAGGEPYAGG